MSSMTSPPERPRRLFLALWPAPDVRRQLADRALEALEAAGQRRVRAEQLHLTLVFMGNTVAERQAAYEAALADLEVPTLRLTLDRYGYWPESQILWLGCRHTPPELYELAATLNRRLSACGFIPERRTFKAHITLARRFPGPLPALSPPEPMHWPIHTITLMASLPESGGCYQPLRSWPGAGCDAVSVE